MIRRLREWLLLSFLPAWVKESVYAENKALKKKNAELRAEIGRLNAYIDGLETGIRSMRRVIINNEVRDK